MSTFIGQTNTELSRDMAPFFYVILRIAERDLVTAMASWKEGRGNGFRGCL